MAEQPQSPADTRGRHHHTGTRVLEGSTVKWTCCHNTRAL